jgi:hypothetical protein
MIVVPIAANIELPDKHHGSVNHQDYRYRLCLEANERRQLCKTWVKQFMRPGQSRQLTKDELFELAK